MNESSDCSFAATDDKLLLQQQRAAGRGLSDASDRLLSTLCTVTR